MALLSSKDSTHLLLTIHTTTLLSDPPLLILTILLTFTAITLISWALSPGGQAWSNARSRRGPVHIPGPRGLPLFGSLFTLAATKLPHQALAEMAAKTTASRALMAFSIGRTPAVVSSDPCIAREILASSAFADRPVKRSARELMFARAIGFAPNGAYWRLLRRIASTHLFCPRRIASHEGGRQGDCDALVLAVEAEQRCRGAVCLRGHLQNAALNNIMGSVFGRRYDVEGVGGEGEVVKGMVREGFELLGAFNWSDHLPWLAWFYDPCDVKRRCGELVPRVRAFVGGIIEEHRRKGFEGKSEADDFVDVLLSLDGDEKLEDDDIVAILWVCLDIYLTFSWKRNKI